MGPLPATTRGHKYILVLFSKWVEVFPLVTTDSVSLVKVLVEEVVCHYGVPQYLHSDQGANLVNLAGQSMILNLQLYNAIPVHSNLMAGVLWQRRWVNKLPLVCTPTQMEIHK